MFKHRATLIGPDGQAREYVALAEVAEIAVESANARQAAAEAQADFQHIVATTATLLQRNTHLRAELDASQGKAESGCEDCITAEEAARGWQDDEPATPGWYYVRRTGMYGVVCVSRSTGQHARVSGFLGDRVMYDYPITSPELMRARWWGPFVIPADPKEQSKGG